jgi:CHAD domain-containing protein
MSFELRKNESIRKGIRRIVRKQLKSARDSLNDSTGEDLDERIHSVRKSLKRVRAVVRLVRYSIGDSAYRIENDSLRDAARPLAEVRDAKILIATLDKLKKDSHDAVKITLFTAARKSLVENKDEVVNKIRRDETAFSATENTIDEAIERVDEWSDLRGDWQSLGKGVKDVYRQGRKAFDAVKLARTVENLHEWRKQVKYLRHQLELLAPTWPKVVGELAKQAEELGELLGEDHDLAVLHCQLSQSVHNDDKPDSELLTSLIESRRKAIQSEAIPKGELLYRDRPKQFERRLKAYWQKWAQRGQKKLAAVC